MTSTARRVLRATAAVTGIATLGAGFAGSAFAAEQQADVQRGGLQVASIDGFNTESVVPVEALSTDVANAVAGGQGPKAPVASPTDLASIGQLQGFNFEMPPTTLGTAAESPAGLAALGQAGSMGLEHVGLPTAGEAQFDQTGMSPMMNPVMQHAVPAIVGGQRVSTAEDTPQSFGSDNGLPEPVNGPANDAAAPVTSSVMPTAASTFGTLSDSTTNDDTTSNHEFQV